VILVLAAAATVLAVVFLPDLLGPDEPTLTEQVTAVIPQVVASQDELRNVVMEITPGDREAASETLHAFAGPRQAVLDALSSAEQTVSKVQTEVAAETTAKSSLLQAFQKHRAFVDSLDELPTNAIKMTVHEVDQCRTAADDTATAYEAAASAFAALEEPYTLSAAVSIQPEDLRSLRITAKRMHKERVFLKYLRAVNRTLVAAKPGRDDIKEAIEGIRHHDEETTDIEPRLAQSLIASAAENRQVVLGEIAALSVPDDARAQQVDQALRSAIELSYEADQQYQLWIDGLVDYYYSDPPGLAGEDPLTRDYYPEADAASEESGIAKQQLCALMNKYNASFGLTTRWDKGEF
jgi:hypothetical protein